MAAAAPSTDRRQIKLISVLRRFVQARLLDDPEINAKHSKTRHGIHGKEYFNALKAHTLERFLKLVAFLDVAKMKKLLPFEPCLFSSDAKITTADNKDRVKSSKDILNRFSK